MISVTLVYQGNRIAVWSEELGRTRPRVSDLDPWEKAVMFWK